MSEPAAEASEEYSEDFRVVNPDTGACVFELGEPWPQPETHANLVRALYALEQAKDPAVPIPPNFNESRVKWVDTIEKRVHALKEAVAAKVTAGEQQPSYAIVHAIKSDGDRIYVVGRSVGRWKDMPGPKQRGVSCDLPYSKFAIETRWRGATVLAEFLADLLDDEDDETEETETAVAANDAPPAAATGSGSDVCLSAGCGAPLAGAAFCAKCGTPRGET